MLRVLAPIFFVLVVASRAAASAGMPVQAPGPADAAAIHDVVRLYASAREAQDPAAIEALFVSDADQLVSSGEWRRGRSVLVAGAIASSASNAGRRTLDVETIRMVTPDVAIADARYVIEGVDGGPARRMWSTFVMARQQGAWRISAIRNMLPVEPVAPAPAPR